MPFWIDKLITHFDAGLKTLTAEQRQTERASPASGIQEAELSAAKKRHIAGLMRINHSGEVCAQALYLGQSMTAKLDQVKTKMEQAAVEETDHLAWCEQRLSELNSHTSVLNPLFYSGSLMLGAFAGAIGDKWSLGFVVETERQVVKHLEKHLAQIPDDDQKTKAVLLQMKEDEQQHATTALNAGGADLPQLVKKTMAKMSKLMTRTTYWI